jgi:hypothetical protein
MAYIYLIFIHYCPYLFEVYVLTFIYENLVRGSAKNVSDARRWRNQIKLGNTVLEDELRRCFLHLCTYDNRQCRYFIYLFIIF